MGSGGTVFAAATSSTVAGSRPARSAALAIASWIARRFVVTSSRDAGMCRSIERGREGPGPRGGGRAPLRSGLPPPLARGAGRGDGSPLTLEEVGDVQVLLGVEGDRRGRVFGGEHVRIVVLQERRERRVLAPSRPYGLFEEPRQPALEPVVGGRTDLVEAGRDDGHAHLFAQSIVDDGAEDDVGVRVRDAGDGVG